MNSLHSDFSVINVFCNDPNLRREDEKDELGIKTPGSDVRTTFFPEQIRLANSVGVLVRSGSGNVLQSVGQLNTK